MIAGSEWWDAEVPETLGDAYTSAVLAAVRGGHAVVEWMTIRQEELEFEVMRAPLAVGTFDDHVFCLGLSAEAVDLIGAELGEVMLMTPQLWDHMAFEARQHQIGPHTLPALLGVPNGRAGMTKTAAKAHADAIAKDRPFPCAAIAGCCKTYVLSPNYRKGFACEYGWRLAGPVGWGSRSATGAGYVVQPAQWAHSYQHFWDYSMAAVYVKRRAKLSGRVVDLADLAQQGHPLVAPQPVAYITHPELGEAPETVREVIPETIRLGSKGDVVREWQRVLTRAGYPLAPWGVDGHFGKLTQNATIAWQKERGLDATGVVDGHVWAARDKAPVPRPDPELEILWYPAVNFRIANRKTVDLIVLHTIEITEASISGDQTAFWMGGRYADAPRVSAHYCIDDDSVYQCVRSEHVAWAAPGANHNGIQIEHAGFARQTLEQWQDQYSTRMLELSAQVAALECKQWDIPIKYVEAIKGARGITTHRSVSRNVGRGRTDHGDPGPSFPMGWYIERVRHYADR